MITLLLFQVRLWSLKNRLRVRLRRLKQPRYLISFLIGVAYIAFIWRPWSRGGARIGDAPYQLGPAFGEAAEVVAAALLTTFLVLAWVWPRWRPALVFSETEIAFLFPAPLSRRQVVGYSLARSQLGLVFSALMISLFAVRQVSPSFWQGFAGTWLVFTTLSMYNLGTAITRSSLLRHGVAAWRRAAPLAVALSVLVVALATWWRHWLRAPSDGELAEGASFARYLVEMGDAGAMRWLLLPARLLVRPAVVAGGLPSFALALAPALALLAVSYLWVIRSDFAYEEASAERAAKRASRRVDRRTRRRRYERVAEARRRPPFQLGGWGRPEVAILWKNLIASGRFLTVRRAATLAFCALAFAAAFSRLATEPWVSIGRAIGTVLLPFSGVLFLLGPLLARSDLRTDLQFASTLKTWPLPGWSVVLGEALAPTLLVSFAQVLLFAVSCTLAPLPFATGVLDRVALVAAAVVLALPLNLLSVLVQAATVLFFPAWLTLGPDRARGLEALGQRLVAMAARLLVLAIAFLPAVGILALVLVLLYPILGNLAVPLAAGLAALPALAESIGGIYLLGIRFDHFDPGRELDVVS